MSRLRRHKHQRATISAEAKTVARIIMKNPLAIHWTIANAKSVLDETADGSLAHPLTRAATR